MRKISFIVIALFLTTLANAQKIKTMIITGQDNNHWWEGGSDAVKKILENSGLFTADILAISDPDKSTESYHPDFKKYDLVVINYGGVTWSEKTRKDFETFVSNGGGVVVLHSSVVPMDDWKEYNKMIGLGAWNGRNEKDGPYVYWKESRFVYDYSPGDAGYHGLQHPYTITHRNTEHPILKGLPPVWKHFKDELYAHLRGPAENMEVLATAFETAGDGDEGRDEPVIWTVNYGKGKVFVTVLGHAGNDPPLRYSMECTGYQAILLRGAEWAATGNVTQAVPKDLPLEGTCTFRKAFKALGNAY